MAGFDLNNFSYNISQYGYNKASSFDVQLTMPKVFTSTNNNINLALSQIPRLLQMRAQNIVIPSVAFMSTESTRYGMGPTTLQPYNAKFSDVPMTFLCDSQDEIFLFFYEWMNKIYNFSENASSTTSVINSLSSVLSVQEPNYTANYEDDIVSDVITITTYNPIGGITKQVNLYRAKPIAMISTPMAWEAVDTLMKVNVVMSFREWAVIMPNSPQNPSGQGTVKVETN